MIFFLRVSGREALVVPGARWYVPPQVPPTNHVVEPERLEPRPTTESDEQQNGVLEQDPASMSSPENDQEGQREQTYQLPTRTRYPPRVLTYDELGIPTYNVRQLSGTLQTPQQNLQYGSAYGLLTWLPPVQQYCYQLPFVYGIH